jgi:hypothetical protein
MHNFLPVLLLSFNLNTEYLPELEGISSRQNGLHCPLAQLVGVVLQLISQHSASLKSINQKVKSKSKDKSGFKKR